MPSLGRTVRRVSNFGRQAQIFGRAMYSGSHPILANIVVTRRCNLSCTYCNQYDKVSPPVPLETMRERLGHLARLGTSAITFTGGEPLLHPGIVKLVEAVHAQGALCTVNTNGYLLTRDLIRQFNRAGLDYLWISVDNIQPDETSMKSLKVLDQKLQWLAEYAHFGVTVNSVLGAGVSNPEDAYRVAERARELGFTSTVGIVHGEGGGLIQLGADQRNVYERIGRLKSESIFSMAHHDSFQDNLVRGQANQWHCVAGGRFLYICEDGLVHYCSQRRGEPGVPLAQYTSEDVVRRSAERKPCAPFCTINCVQQVSYLDSFRRDPSGAVDALYARKHAADPSFEPPLAARLLQDLFLQSKTRRLWELAAIRLLRLRG